MKWQFLDKSLAAFAVGFPHLDDTSVVMADVGDYRSKLFADEQEELTQMAEVRQLGFSSGRYCAHLAQQGVGVEPQAVRRENRVPIWPSSSVGSITHSSRIAAAIASKDFASVGIDIEELGRVEKKLYRMLFTDAEQTRLSEYDFDAASILFSAKEAGYKAIYPIGQKFVGFQEAEIHIEPEFQRFTIDYIGEHPPNVALNRGCGYWHFCADHVLTVFVIPNLDKC